jgi:uncharacterized protein YaaR (DUF327 family)
MAIKVKRQDGPGHKIQEGQSGSGQSRSAVSGNASQGTAPFVASMEDAELSVLFERLDALVKKLTLFPTEKLIREYRSLIGEFISRAAKGMNVHRDLKWRRNNRSIFITVEKTEAALRDLEAVLLREGTRVRAIQLMEEIKGCLISLFG